MESSPTGISRRTKLCGIFSTVIVPVTCGWLSFYSLLYLVLHSLRFGTSWHLQEFSRAFPLAKGIGGHALSVLDTLLWVFRTHSFHYVYLSLALKSFAVERRDNVHFIPVCPAPASGCNTQDYCWLQNPSCRTQVAPQPQAVQNHTLGLPMQLQKGGLWERTLAGVCESPQILDFSIPCRFGQRIWIRHD